MLLDSPEHAVASARWVVQAVARGTQQGAPLTNDAAQVFRDERFTLEVAHQSGPAVRDTDDFVAVAHGHTADGSNGRVKPRCVTARSQNTDAHETPSPDPRSFYDVVSRGLGKL